MELPRLGKRSSGLQHSVSAWMVKNLAGNLPAKVDAAEPWRCVDVALGKATVISGMSPVQEIANAVTMMPTALMSLRVLLEDSAPPCVCLVALAVLLHFPFSFVYHICCARFHGVVDPIENNMGLKLDLAFIHIDGAMIALATSGSYVWFAVVAVFNIVCAIRTALWCNTVLERRTGRVACALGYLLPIAFFDVALFLASTLSFTVMAVPFVMNRHFGGWGHALSHLLLVPLAHLLFDSAALVTWPGA